LINICLRVTKLTITTALTTTTLATTTFALSKQKRNNSSKQRLKEKKDVILKPILRQRDVELLW